MTNEVIRLYVDENKSTLEIATILNLSVSKVRRTLVRAGVTLRGRSEAQSLAIKSNRAKHPTKGKGHKDETKKKIAKKNHEAWNKLDEEERERRSEMAKEYYKTLTYSEKEDMKERRHAGLSKTSKEGSRMEKFVHNFLLSSGYGVQYHRAGFLANRQLEVDLLVPEIRTAIEIDGPAHFLPIWGEANLQKHINADSQKSGLLLSEGYNLVRVKCLKKNISPFLIEETAQKILVELDKIKNTNVRGQLIEIEIK